MSGALEISGSVDGLLDDDIVLRARGAGPDAALTWRARYRDDDGRIWRAAGPRAEDLATRWVPAKDGTGPIAALRSLRPVSIDVRVETADGRGAGRALTRRLAGEGVRTRRWRDGLVATLHIPPGCETAHAAGATFGAAPAHAAAVQAAVAPAATPCATVVIDATDGDEVATVAMLAAPLLASRGALVLVVGPVRRRSDGDPLAVAHERLAALPAASGEILVLRALDPFDPDATGDGVLLPPGVGARDPQHSAAGRAVAWDALLARLGARPRERAAPGRAASSSSSRTKDTEAAAR